MNTDQLLVFYNKHRKFILLSVFSIYVIYKIGYNLGDVYYQLFGLI